MAPSGKKGKGGGNKKKEMGEEEERRWIMATLTRHKAVGKGRKKKGKSSTKSLEENWLSEYNNLRVAGRAKQDSTLFFFFFFSVRACFSLSGTSSAHGPFFLSFFPFSLRAINRRPPLPSEEEEKENYSIYYSVCARDVAHTLYTCWET